MAINTLTLIQYIIPDDHDELSMPNAFVINKPQAEIKLSDVIEHFPLEGTYHFRFKYAFKNEFVWLDLNNTNCRVPSVEGNIKMKATRITWESKRSHKKSLSSETPPKGKISNLLIEDVPTDIRKPPTVKQEANFDLLFGKN